MSRSTFHHQGPGYRRRGDRVEVLVVNAGEGDEVAYLPVKPPEASVPTQPSGEREQTALPGHSKRLYPQTPR